MQVKSAHCGSRLRFVAFSCTWYSLLRSLIVYLVLLLLGFVLAQTYSHTFYKEVRNVTAGGAFTTSVSGKPDDVLEYRINYTRTGPPIFDILLEDTLDSNVTLEQNAYGASTDKEITLRCPDGTDVFLEAGAVTTLSIDLVAECTLNTSTDSTSTVREDLLNGEGGHFLFRAKIR